MTALELLAPAKDAEIGIAAIDCGADAVYMAGPRFGARQAAGNPVESVAKVCSHARKFGAKVFVTLNTILYEDELGAALDQLEAVQEAGADAVIIQDLALSPAGAERMGLLAESIRIPFHASTQCAIRTPEQARFLESLGFSRLILERELSLAQIRKIREEVSCELEAFVHGALCVCYSGQCYLSEYISGRSANRGACIQACRSRYDLSDENGRILIKDRSLLSLKDLNLIHRLRDLAEAGINSFKIEGRLKNISYVRNVVGAYSNAIDNILSSKEMNGKFRRESYGKVTLGFTPDVNKTFNRGYTELYIDGKRDRWASADAAKSMGEAIGTVESVSRNKDEITIRPFAEGLKLANGDGFAFVNKSGIVEGFRGDICNGLTIKCKPIAGIWPGARIFRNLNTAFEKEMERKASRREILCDVSMKFGREPSGEFHVRVSAHSEDGREFALTQRLGTDAAENPDRAAEMIRRQMEKTAGIYRFRLVSLEAEALPFTSASSVNEIRRILADGIDSQPCFSLPLFMAEKKESQCMAPRDAGYKCNISNSVARDLYLSCGSVKTEDAFELSHQKNIELMRTRYCIRRELGICPKHPSPKANPELLKAAKGKLFLLNNGRRLCLNFDCSNCEMTVTT
ncbi:MAG: peptidase U32 family protein [Candidatus Cryptobacteroides sp.]